MATTLEKRLKTSKNYALLGWGLALTSIIYFATSFIKAIMLASADSDITPFTKLHYMLLNFENSLIGSPLYYFWSLIPPIPLSSNGWIDFYSVLIPPTLTLLIATFFLSDYRAVRSYYRELKFEVQKEKNKRELLEQAGIHDVSDKKQIELQINNSQYKKPHWIKTAFGQVAVGVSVVAICVGLGLQ